MPPEGKGTITPIQPGVLARVVQGVRYAISGVQPDAWFGPLQPLQPVAQEAAGRLWPYQAGYNLNIQPRPYEPGIFQTLRGLASSGDIVRLLIETRKDQIEALPWSIKPKADYAKNASAIATAKKIEKFMQYPDQVHPFPTWLRMLLEDMLVIDAATIYRRRTRGGELYSLDVMDGATIARKITDDGRIPAPPDPAYQQIINGSIMADYSTDEIMYSPRNLRPHTVYGYSPVEQIMITVNTIIRRQLSQLEYYDTGNVPLGLLAFPKDVTAAQVSDFMKDFNAKLQGNTAERNKLYPVVNGTEYKEIKTPPLVTKEVEEWYARVCCFAFSIPPTPFVQMMNRATAAVTKDAALEEGLGPIMLWWKRLFDRIIQTDFGTDEVEFDWLNNKEVDPEAEMRIVTGYTGRPIMSVNEGRQRIGMEATGNPDDDTIGTAFPDPFAEDEENNPAADAKRTQGGGDDEDGDDEEEAKTAKAAGYTNLKKGVRRKRPIPLTAKPCAKGVRHSSKA